MQRIVRACVYLCALGGREEGWGEEEERGEGGRSISDYLSLLYFLLYTFYVFVHGIGASLCFLEIRFRLQQLSLCKFDL